MRKKYFNPFLILVIGSLCFLGSLVSSCESGSKYNAINGKLSFNRDVRPILNSKCIACHGGVKKSGGLSFILQEEALSEIKSGKHAIVPGDPSQSEMIHRIKSDDPDFRMPMNEEPLSKEEMRRRRAEAAAKRFAK